MNRTTITTLTASLALAATACGQKQDDPVDTTFEAQGPAPVAVDPASTEPAETNEVGDTQDDVVVEGQGGTPSGDTVNKEIGTAEAEPAPPPAAE